MPPIIISICLAFAILNPDFELYLFFFVPIKMKWLAILDGVLLGIDFVYSSWSGRIALLAALANLLIFFTPQLVERIRGIYRKWKWKRNFRK